MASATGEPKLDQGDVVTAQVFEELEAAQRRLREPVLHWSQASNIQNTCAVLAPTATLADCRIYTHQCQGRLAIHYLTFNEF